MYAKRIWIHPSQRRFRTQMSVTGAILTQELTGVQTREVVALGANQADYAGIVRESEATDFKDGLQHSASEQVNMGLDVFQVQGTGTKKLKAGQTHAGSFVLSTNC